MEPGQKVVSFKEFQKLEMRSGTMAQGEAELLDIGNRKVKASVDNPVPGKRYAAFIAGGKALVLHGPDKIKITFDKDIPVGAKIR